MTENGEVRSSQLAQRVEEIEKLIRSGANVAGTSLASLLETAQAQLESQRGEEEQATHEKKEREQHERVAAAQGFTSSPVATLNGEVLSIVFTVELLATDVTLEPQWSEDLGSWEANGFTLETLSEIDSIRTVKASVAAGTIHRFLRLAVIEP